MLIKVCYTKIFKNNHTYSNSKKSFPKEALVVFVVYPKLDNDCNALYMYVTLKCKKN